MSDGEPHDLTRIVRLQSLVDVERGSDPGYLFRFIYRWYSREFSTPLHEVENLPTEDVLRHYFEVKYEDLSKDEEAWAAEKERMLYPERAAAAAAKEELQDLDDLSFLQHEASKGEPSETKIDQPNLADSLDAMTASVREGVARMKEARPLPDLPDISDDFGGPID